jgi:RimJ/RimL family protein N-acetyltransferase
MKGIETERTILRIFTMDDLDGLASIFGNPQVMKYLELDCKPLSRETTEIALISIIKHWENNGFGRWAVVSKEDHKLIGMAGFRSHEDCAELVYILDEPYWSKGLATEIARAILKFGFETQNFPVIMAMTRPANVLSRRVLDKLGMNFEREAIAYGIEVVEYTLSQEEYRRRITNPEK